MRILVKLLRLVMPHWGKVVVATALGVATVGSGIGLVGTAAFLIATAALQPSIAELQVAIVGVRFFGLGRGVFRYLERLVSHRLTLDLLGRLRVWFYRALEPLAPARTLELRSSDLLTRAVGDVESLQGLYVRALAPPLVAVIVAAGVISFIAAFSLFPAAAFGIAYAVTALGVPFAVERLSRPFGRRVAEARADLTAAVVDGVQGMADLLAADRGSSSQRQVEALSAQLVRDRLAAARIEALGSAATTFATHATVWIVLVVSISRVRADIFDGVALAVICLIAMAAFEAVQPLPVAAQHLSEQLAAAARVFAIVDSKPAVSDPPFPVLFEPADDQAIIELHDLSFIYPGESRPALTSIDFTISPGEQVAVVGPSGAGKSTLAHLLLRFWDPTSGSIRLAGERLNAYALEDLRSVIALLSQRTDLFSGTIRENLLLAAPNVSEDALVAAAESAEILSAIGSFPEGWDTWVGEHGLHLSGGQRQRLAIARILLRDPRLVVFDEPTKGLDAVTEQRVLKSLRRVMAGRTTIHITHRLLAMEEMDQILVFDRGRIVERGCHGELIETDGLYRQLHDSQALGVQTVV